MIQSQFDAATKLGNSSGASDEREIDERPRKRRKTTPPVEDSIEVAAEGPRPDDASCSPQNVFRNGSIDASDCIISKLSEDIGGTSIDTASRNNINEDHAAAAGVTSPAALGLTAQAGDSTLSSPSELVIVVSDKASMTKAEPGQQNLTEESGAMMETLNLHDRKNAPTQAANIRVQASDPADMSSPSPSALQPRGPRTYPTNDGLGQHDKARCLSAIPRHLEVSTISSQATSPSSGPSTPKNRPSSAPQTKYSSPLSSPPSELFDPFDEPSSDPPPSSSRPSSPVSDEEGGDEPSFQDQIHRSSTLRRSLSTLKGRELFDASIWSDPLKTSVFYTFATNLRQRSRDVSPTSCHHFIRHLSEAGKMVRCYTQNIDLLEDKVGLSTHLLLGPGSRSRFSTRNSKNMAGTSTPRNTCNNNNQPALIPPVALPTSDETNGATLDDSITSGESAPSDGQEAQTNSAEEVKTCDEKPGRDDGAPLVESKEQDAEREQKCTDEPEKTDVKPTNPSDKPMSGAEAPGPSGSSTPERDRGVECVFLHGSLRSLRCFQCGGVVDWDEGDRELRTMSGEQPPCPRCEHATAARQERGKRALGVGKLRPDIVLYGEEHPEAQRISTIIQHDIALAPDLLIIMGTSLKVHGLKTVVREFAKTVHNRKDGKVIFVNYTKPADSVWADIIDFWIEMDCDAWIEDLKGKKPIIWLPPGSVEEETRSTKRRRPAKEDVGKKESKKTRKDDSSKKSDTAEEAAKDSNPMVPVDFLSAKEKTKNSKKPAQEVISEGNNSVTRVPQRPAAHRDCKHNGAYWTIKILDDLARISGRKRIPTSAPAFLPAMIAASESTPPIKEEAVTQKQLPPPDTKARRRPRTKNTKSRKAMLEAEGTSQAAEEQHKSSSRPKKVAKPRTNNPARPVSKKKSKGQQNNTPSQLAKTVDAVFVPITEDGSVMPSSNGDSSVTLAHQEASGLRPVQENPVLAEVPVPNSGPTPDMDDNSILAAVKSNHRIRKPKAIFGETDLHPQPNPRRNTPGLGASSKSKTRAASQTKKNKSSVTAESISENLQTGGPEDAVQQTHRLSLPLLPHPVPQISPVITQPAAVGATYTLRPIQSLMESTNMGRRASFLETALGPSPAAPSSPPNYLEPMVMDLSPHKRWYQPPILYHNPPSRPCDLPQRPLAFGGVTYNHRGSGANLASCAASPMPPSPADLPVAPLRDAPAMYADRMFAPLLSPAIAQVPIVDDSPSQQLQRENEAAAALKQLSQMT